MIKIFRTIDGAIHQVNEAQEGCWIAMINPTATEILEMAAEYRIEQDDLRAPLDEEERSRIAFEDNYVMILVDVSYYRGAKRQRLVRYDPHVGGADG